jgi:nucleoid-associated protein YgaU
MAGGALQKLRIRYNKGGRENAGQIEAMFNPTEIGWSRAISWQPEPVVGSMDGWGRFNTEQLFLAARPATMSVNLFFDTYEARTGPTDVRKLTRAVAELAEVDTELHHPPVCRLSWGVFDNIFTGVVTELDQTFSMFLADGTPVRATVSCSFTEYATRAHALRRELHSADVHKTWIVRRADTLHGIAAAEYGDPSLWRHIAEANGIVNPRRDLRSGAVLKLPRLDG